MGIITLTIGVLVLINLTGGNNDMAVGNLIGLGLIWLAYAVYWVFKDRKEDND